MSLTILGGWIAASVILSPLIGRFLAGPDKGKARPHPMANHPGISSRARTSRPVETMRRNVVIQLARREAGWPRAG